MRDQIEKAIRETLVIENKESIGIAVDKIMKLLQPIAELSDTETIFSSDEMQSALEKIHEITK